MSTSTSSSSSSSTTTTSSSSSRSIGILGCGSLGEFLIRNILSNPSLNLTLAFAWNRSPNRLDLLIQQGLIPASARCDDLSTCSRFNADIIIEVCHPDVTKEWGSKLLLHSDFVCGSPTALADDAIFSKLIECVTDPKININNKGLYIPSGALWGAIDLRKLSQRKSLAFLEITMKKHPLSLKLEGELGSKLATFIASGSKPGIECILYEGPVRQLCPLAPNNVNTMAAAAIAAYDTLGFDGVQCRLIADFGLDAHIITIDARGPTRLGQDGLSNAQPFRVFTERYNPAAPGAVTGSATYLSFLSSIVETGGKGRGIFMC